jgi:hypothetical protein
MYWIVGGDGREYGPITLEQLEGWIAEGRVDSRSRIRAEGSTEWLAAAAFPELARVLGTPAAGAPPPPPPLPGAAFGGEGEASAIAGEILSRPVDLRIESCFSRGWQLLQANFGLLVGAAAIVVLLEVAIAAVPIAGGPALLILGGVLNGGLAWMFLGVKRGLPMNLGDCFAGFRIAFVPLMLGGLVSSLLTSVGIALCILPGIYLAVSWVFTLLLVADKRLDFWPAMELSRKVVGRIWWPMFGFSILSGLLCFAGILACVVGLFVAVPLVLAAFVYAYDDIFGETPSAPLSASSPAI